MDPSNDKIVDKIKKLLALASSPNENEAKLAMERAQKLMAEYCIGRDLIYAQEFGPELVTSEMYSSPYAPSRGLQKELPTIANTIAKIFGCAVLVQLLEPRIYGFKTNIEITRYTLDAILNQARADYKLGYQKARTITFDETFWSAFSSTIYRRFATHVTEANALTVYDPVRAEITKNSTGTYSNIRGTDAITGLQAGSASGSSVSLNPGLNAGFQGGLLK